MPSTVGQGFSGNYFDARILSVGCKRDTLELQKDWRLKRFDRLGPRFDIGQREKDFGNSCYWFWETETDKNSSDSGPGNDFSHLFVTHSSSGNVAANSQFSKWQTAAMMRSFPPSSVSYMQVREIYFASFFDRASFVFWFASSMFL